MGVSVVETIITFYRGQLVMNNGMFEIVNGEALKAHQAGMHQMMPNKSFYPDSNAILRRSYSKLPLCFPSDNDITGGNSAFFVPKQ